MPAADAQPPAAPPAEDDAWPAWEDAWAQALYGRSGFYRTPEGPAGHFRTACHAAPQDVARVVLALAAEGGCTSVVDVGAGRGELAAALQVGPGPRVGVHAVDVVERPPSLPAPVGWARAEPDVPGPANAVRRALSGTAGPVLVTAFELLDVVACPVVERDADGRWRRVHVQPATGRERLGARVDGDDAAWLARWWDGAADPDTRGEGARAEVGRSREEVWAGLVRAVADHPGGGVLLAVDYAHTLTTRPAEGSLAAFRAGRAVPPRADGNCDVTAHVAMDAVEAAGEAAGAVTIARLSQAEAIRRWWHGPSTPAAELRDPGALGGFSWLVQAVR